MKYIFKLEEKVKGHAFLRDANGKDVLNSNGYVTKQAALDAAAQVFAVGNTFKGKKIVKNAKTKTSFSVTTE